MARRKPHLHTHRRLKASRQPQKDLGVDRPLRNDPAIATKDDLNPWNPDPTLLLDPASVDPDPAVLLDDPEYASGEGRLALSDANR